MFKRLCFALLAFASPALADSRGFSAEEVPQSAKISSAFRTPADDFTHRHGVPREATASLCLDGFGCLEITVEQAIRIILEQEAAGLCGLCQTQEPPPDPTNYPGFCTGLRDEYAHLDSDFLGGVAAAYNYCIDQGTAVRTCSCPCNPPQNGCTRFGTYRDEYYWSPTHGECVRHCTRCTAC
jgi:hypothetical protein